MASIENSLTQVKIFLNVEKIKLWLEPYYTEGIGPNERELAVSFFCDYYNLTFYFETKKLYFSKYFKSFKNEKNEVFPKKLNTITINLYYL